MITSTDYSEGQQLAGIYVGADTVGVLHEINRVMEYVYGADLSEYQRGYLNGLSALLSEATK